jgi:di/tricarboxylate transporter
VVIFLPIALSLAEASNSAPSKLLMPLSFATIAGGMCTLIGTSTNLLVSNALPLYEIEALDFFEPLPLALIGTAMTMLYLLTVGRKLLPSRRTIASGTRGGRIVDYVTELAIPPGSPLIGRSIAEAIPPRAPDVQVLQLIRGEEILDPSEWEWVLQAGDALIVKGDVNSLLGLQRDGGLTLATELATPELRVRTKDMTLAELLIRPPSTAIGERVRDLNLYQRHGVAVLAVQRHGVHIREKVADLRLRMGDILLVEAEAPALEALRDARNFVLLEGVQEQVTLPHKARWALAVVLSVIVLATADIPGLPISVLAVAGALAMVLIGCLSTRDAYRAMDLPILVLVAGTICLGIAMEKSGAAAWIAGGLVGVVSPWGDVALLSGIYLITNVLTALISNNGSALLMLPIALETAELSGLSPTPFILAIMFAASIDYSTPIGYQVNTIIYGPGGYRFSDFVKVGGPLNVLWWILATLLIPVFWPLSPG